jgi:hypothetical protein
MLVARQTTAVVQQKSLPWRIRNGVKDADDNHHHQDKDFVHSEFGA